MTTEMIITIVCGVLSVILSILNYYLVVRRKIETSALDAINQAEDLDKVGKEKMAEAVETIYATLPVVVKPFINKSLIEMIVQKVFDKVEEFAKKQK